MFISSNCKVAALADFAKNAVNACKNSAQTESNFVALADYVDGLEKSLTAAIKKDKIPSNLEALDSSRDKNLRAINALIAAAVAHPDSSIESAGKEAKAIFSKYGMKISRSPYEDESTYIRSMLQDFSPIASSTKLISGFDETLSALQSSEDDFEKEYAAYMKAISSASKSATDIKKELVTALNSGLLPYIEAVCLVNDGYKPLKDEIEVLISHLS